MPVLFRPKLLQSDEEKKLIFCPVCNEPVFKNVSVIPDETHYVVYNLDWKCGHFCCEFNINNYKFNEAPDYAHVSGMKFHSNLIQEGLFDMPSVRQFLMDRKPDRAVLVSNPQTYSHHYFFFKSEGFNFLQIMEDQRVVEQVAFNPAG